MAALDGVKTKRMNQLKWLVVLVLLVVSVVGNLYFDWLALAVRASLLIVMAVAVLALAKTTEQGEWAWRFLKESRMEMRKVVWPTRQETVQTTLLVVALVMVMSLILWGIDSVFALIVSAIIS